MHIDLITDWLSRVLRPALYRSTLFFWGGNRSTEHRYQINREHLKETGQKLFTARLGLVTTPTRTLFADKTNLRSVNWFADSLVF